MLPAAAILPAVPTRGLSLLLLGAYALLGLRVLLGLRRRGAPLSDAGLYAVFCVLGKQPQMEGQLLYWMRRLTGTRARIIEHKGASPPG